MRKNRARKGRELELQGPDSQLQSASSSPAWQGDMHSKGYNGQPCASGVYILNLEGKKGEPRRGCWRLDKKQQFCEEIYTNQVTENLDTNGGYSPNMNRVQLHDSSLLLRLLHPQPKTPGVSPSLPLSAQFSVAPLVLPGWTQSSFLVPAHEAKPVGKTW